MRCRSKVNRNTEKLNFWLSYSDMMAALLLGTTAVLLWDSTVPFSEGIQNLLAYRSPHPAKIPQFSHGIFSVFSASCGTMAAESEVLHHACTDCGG